MIKIGYYFRSLFRKYGYIQNFIMFPVQGMLRKIHAFRLHVPYEKIESFKNIYNGERCFIISTGPSLEIKDLEMISENDVTFSMNTIFKLFPRTQWRPTYYVMFDSDLHRTLNKQFDLDFDSFAKKNSFLSSHNKNIIKSKNSILLNINFLDHYIRYGKSKLFRYTGDFLYGFYDNYSVTQDSIILAIYMGFKEIYLLGADNDYLGDKQHFEKDDGHDGDLSYVESVKTQNANDLGYEFVKTVAQKNDVRIYNATRGGRVECFDRKKLEDIV